MLGNSIWKFGKPLQSSSLICQSPTKAIWWFILKTIYTYAACLCIELCQIFVTLERNFYYAFMIKIHVHTIYPLLCFFEKLALYHPLISQNKCSTICVGLSLSLQFLLKKKKRGMSYREKIYGHMKVQVLKRKRKRIYIWTHEGPWKKER